LKQIATNLADISERTPPVRLGDACHRRVSPPRIHNAGRSQAGAGPHAAADRSALAIPICLDVNEITARPMEAGQSVALRDPEGFLRQ
jgi:hypothetical protein